MPQSDPIVARRIAASRRELARVETAWGPLSGKLLPALLNLADLYFAISDYHHAEQLYSRYLNIACKAHGHQHPNIAHALRLMGEVYEVQGLYREAEHYYLWALDVRQKAGNQQRDCADLLGRLIVFYRGLEEEFKARVIEKRLRACLTTRQAV